jgi:hypothetical protein
MKLKAGLPLKKGLRPPFYTASGQCHKSVL